MSSSKKPVVLVTEGSDPKPLDWLRQHARVCETPYDDPNIDKHLNWRMYDQFSRGLFTELLTRVPHVTAGEPQLMPGNFFHVVKRMPAHL